MKKTADAVVIGGGIAGASTLYYLASMGLRETVLLEKGDLASGSTGDSAAMVRQHYSNEVSIRLVRESLRFFQGFADEFDGARVFNGIGWLFLCEPDAREAFDENMAQLKRLGVRTWEISPEDAAEELPGLNTDGIGPVAFEPDSGYADPRGTVSALVKKAETLGAEVYTHTAATGLVMEGGRISGVVTSSGTVSAPIVVNAAGPWAGEVGRWAGLNLPLVLSREQDVVIRIPENTPALRRVVSNMVDRTYFRPEGDGLLLAGVGHPKENEPVDPDCYHCEADADFVEDVTGRLERRLPGLAGAEVVSSWAGLYTITPDWNMMVGAASGVDGLYLAVGGSGHSFKLGPAIGRCLAELITEGRASSVDITPLRPDRFDDGSPLRSTYGGNRA